MHPQPGQFHAQSINMAHPNQAFQPQRQPREPAQILPHPLQNIRTMQIQQLYAFYPDTVLMDRSQTSEGLRVPLQIPQSQQPLFVKVTVPFAFPQQGPQVHVLNRVVHAKISRDD